MLQKLAVLSLSTVLIIACNPQKEQASTTEVPSENTVKEMSELEKEHQLFRPGYADSINAGLIPEDTMVTSARRLAEGTVGGTEISINYGSPGKRGRVIWNGLVSYDQVWVTGSHWATAITFGQDVKIEGTTIPAGTYGFFTIPGRENWTLILNEVYDQHLAEEYQQSQDLVRVQVQAKELEDVVQRLTYELEDLGDGKGMIHMSWDQVQVSLAFDVN